MGFYNDDVEDRKAANECMGTIETTTREINELKKQTNVNQSQLMELYLKKIKFYRLLDDLLEDGENSIDGMTIYTGTISKQDLKDTKSNAKEIIKTQLELLDRRKEAINGKNGNEALKAILETELAELKIEKSVDENWRGFNWNEIGQHPEKTKESYLNNLDKRFSGFYDVLSDEARYDVNLRLKTLEEEKYTVKRYLPILSQAEVSSFFEDATSIEEATQDIDEQIQLAEKEKYDNECDDGDKDEDEDGDGDRDREI